MNTIDMYEEDPLAPKCESCEVPLKDHLGLTGTCRQLQEAKNRAAYLAKLLSTLALSDCDHNTGEFGTGCTLYCTEDDVLEARSYLSDYGGL